MRNYQARNFMRDQMQVGDGVLFYHSTCAEPGIAGLAEVASSAYPDATQFDPKSQYYDPKSTRDEPRWVHVDVQARARRRACCRCARCASDPSSPSMVVLRAGNRLSITPVTRPSGAP